jgi:hypothetical protein
MKKFQAECVLVRLPPPLKAWIVEEAGRNCASYNSEVVRAIREKMERVQTAASLAKARERGIFAAPAE